MKKKLKRNKAFTLIELLIVIAVLSILVLLAAPKLLGYTKDAKLAQIQNDVRVNENMIQVKTLKNDELTKDWEIVENSLIEEYKNDSSLFNKKGLVSSNEILDDEFLSIPEEFIDSKLKGDFLYAAKGGLIYYHTDEILSESDEDQDHIDTNPQISCFVESEFESPQEPKLLGSFKLNVTRDHFISLSGIGIWHNPESPNFKFTYMYPPYGSGLPSIDVNSNVKKDVPTGELKAWNYSFQYKLSGNNFYSGGPADIDVYRIYDHIPRFEGTPTVRAISSEKRKMTKLEISGLALDINSRNTGEAESLMLSYDVRNSEIKNKGLGCLKVNRQANFNEISYIDEELPVGNYQLTLSIKNAKGQTSSRSISFNVEKGDF